MGLLRLYKSALGLSPFFFYNEHCPEVIGIVWRPQVFNPNPFSAKLSENSCPADDSFNGGILLSRNLGDLMREMTQYTRDIVTSIRIFDNRCLPHFSKRRKLVHK